MAGSFIAMLVGAVLVGMGIYNIKGNISSLHSYHRSRVKEEDRLPFGRLVGIGNITMGCGIILFGILTMMADLLVQGYLIGIGIAIMISCLVVGLGISFYAMKKYNGGIF